MIEVYVYNNSGAAKRPAKLNIATGIIRFEDGSYTSVVGESVRGCRVEEVPAKEEVAPTPVSVKAPEAAPSPSKEQGTLSLEKKISELKEKAKRLTKAERKYLRELEGKLASALSKSKESEE